MHCMSRGCHLSAGLKKKKKKKKKLFPLKFLWTKIRSIWSDNDRHWFWWRLLDNFRRKIAQLCIWMTIRTKQWLVVAVSAFQCMRTDFLCPKCYNFACLYTRKDQNEPHLKRWVFVFAKIGIFCKSIVGPLSEAKTHWMVKWLQLLSQLDFAWRHTKVFMRNSY